MKKIPKKIPFTNSKGDIIRLRGDLTIGDLVQLGIKVSMRPKGKPMPKNPRIYVYPAK